MRTLGAIVLALLGCRASVGAQVLGLSLGFTSSGVDWLYPPTGPLDSGAKVSSGRDRRAGTGEITVRRHLDLGPWLQSGLRVVPKGFTAGRPTLRMLYLEVPALVVLQRRAKTGVFAEGGLVAGVRVRCRRVWIAEDDCGHYVDATSDLPAVRRLDLSWSVGAGVRSGSPESGWRGFVVRYQRSRYDLEPGEGGKMLNRVLTVSALFEGPDPGRR